MPLSVQNPTVKWVFEPAMMFRSEIVRATVACVRPALVKPCLHSPPSLVCQAEQDLDPVVHLPFMQHCEDVDSGGGLKLFD